MSESDTTTRWQRLYNWFFDLCVGRPRPEPENETLKVLTDINQKLSIIAECVDQNPNFQSRHKCLRTM